jgi:hypothetical protein
MALRAAQIHEDAARLVGLAPSPARSPLAPLPAAGRGRPAQTQGGLPHHGAFSGERFSERFFTGIYWGFLGVLGQSGDLTLLLRQWNGGDSAALDPLFELVFPQLRQIAASLLRGERRGTILQPTDAPPGGIMTHRARLDRALSSAGPSRAVSARAAGVSGCARRIRPAASGAAAPPRSAPGPAAPGPARSACFRTLTAPSRSRLRDSTAGVLLSRERERAVSGRYARAVSEW